MSKWMNMGRRSARFGAWLLAVWLVIGFGISVAGMGAPTDLRGVGPIAIGDRSTGVVVAVAAEECALPPLRCDYMREVAGIADRVRVMRDEGRGAEEIARWAHAERRALGVKYKNLTPPDMLERIYTRNLNLYGDKWGPGVEWLRAKGKTWDEITASASRTGGKDLGF